MSSTETVNVETEAVKVEIEAVNAETETVKVETEAVTAETETVNAETEAVNAETETANVEIDTVNVETEAVTVETKAVTAETEAVKVEIETVNVETKAVETVKVETGAVNVETKAVNIETKAVNAETEAVNVETETVNVETEAVNVETKTVNAETKAVYAETEAVNVETEAVNAETEAVNVETKAVNAETETVNAETEAVNVETEAVNVEAETVNVETEAVSVETKSVNAETEAVNVEAETVNVKRVPTVITDKDIMADKKEVDGCLKWISNQQTLQETSEFGSNKRAVDESLAEQKERGSLIRDYGSQVEKIKDGSKDPLLTIDLQKAYDALLVISDRRLDNLQTISQITSLEDLFSTISDAFSAKAADLVSALPADSAQVDSSVFQLNGSTANTSQGCILANRKNWTWLVKLNDCAKIHLQNSAEYHQFYYEVREYHRWMPVELNKAEELLNWATLKRNQQGADATKLIFEIKTALAIVHNWLSKVDAIWERSRHVVPVPLRTKGLDHERPVRVLCDYRTKEINIQDGEELHLQDNSKTHTWKVRNLRGDEFVVPSVILLIPGPDLAATEAALKLRLQFLSAWTNMVKRFGKTIILFLLQVIRVWTPVEESLLRSLSESDKTEIYRLLESIETTFSPYWDLYPPYQLLKSRMQKLREILAQKATAEDKITAESGNLLVIQTKILEELLQKFRGFWQDWERYKVSTESLRHPEYLLSVKDYDDYNFLELSEWLKKWSTALEFDELDYADVGQEVVEEVHTLERAKETAETSHLTTSEQEERQTFVITGVIDPRDDTEISLDQAVSDGIINQTEGRFVNPDTGESIPIPVAMNAGKIKVEMTRTKKSAEKRHDIGLITIRTVKESRPYTIKGVIDAKTERQLSVDEATKAGILDQKKGVYRNLNTKEELSLGDALDSGLLVVEFESSDVTDSKSRDPETETKSYSIHAVIDMRNKSRVGFAEAVQKGLINPDTGAYYNNVTREHVYIGDAIKKGFVKASVVLDKNTIDIDPGNCITLAESAMENFRHKLIQPLKAVQALKAAGSVQNGR